MLWLSDNRCGACDPRHWPIFCSVVYVGQRTGCKVDCTLREWAESGRVEVFYNDGNMRLWSSREPPKRCGAGAKPSSMDFWLCGSFFFFFAVRALYSYVTLLFICSYGAWNLLRLAVTFLTCCSVFSEGHSSLQWILSYFFFFFLNLCTQGWLIGRNICILEKWNMWISDCKELISSFPGFANMVPSVVILIWHSGCAFVFDLIVVELMQPSRESFPGDGPSSETTVDPCLS